MTWLRLLRLVDDAVCVSGMMAMLPFYKMCSTLVKQNTGECPFAQACQRWQNAHMSL
jgi:hypothetical protein